MLSGDSDDALVDILDTREDYSFHDLFKIIRATLRFRKFDGQLSEPVTRITFERGDSAGVLLYDPDDHVVVLVRQFRYPVYAGLDREPAEKRAPEQAWTLEIVAGTQEPERDVREVAHTELLEEAGYVLRGELHPITTIYPSPGGTSERIHLFLGEVDHRTRAGPGGGVASSGEDTQIVVLPVEDAMNMVSSGEIRDAKTIIALQYLVFQYSQQG